MLCVKQEYALCEAGIFKLSTNKQKRKNNNNKKQHQRISNKNKENNKSIPHCILPIKNKINY